MLVALFPVEWLTSRVMSNHFQVLREVPQPPAVLPGAEALLRKSRGLTGRQNVGVLARREDRAPGPGSDRPRQGRMQRQTE